MLKSYLTKLGVPVFLSKEEKIRKRLPGGIQMSSGGGGAGRGGFSVGMNVGGARGAGMGEVDGGNVGGLGVMNQPGLNPYRARGLGMGQARNETPSLNDMRARQGAIVAKL